MNPKSCLMVTVASCVVFGPGSRAAEKVESQDAPAAVPTPSPKAAAQVQLREDIPAQSPPPSPAAAIDRKRLEANKRHVRSDVFHVEVPPPPPKKETKGAPPTSNYVWKPGYWEPAKGEWKWTPGEWAVPPTSISVWIESKYDEKEHRWSPGYWQPDRVERTDSDTTANTPMPVGKF